MFFRYLLFRSGFTMLYPFIIVAIGKRSNQLDVKLSVLKDGLLKIVLLINLRTSVCIIQKIILIIIFLVSVQNFCHNSSITLDNINHRYVSL